jgi:outer membrane protein
MAAARRLHVCWHTTSEDPVRLYARLVLIAAVLFVAVPAAVVAQRTDGSGPQPISLDEAVAQAQANAPQTVQAKGVSRVANAQYKASIANFLPTVNFGQGTSHSIGQVYVQGVLLSTGGGWNSSQGYSAGVTLFDGGQNILDYRAAKASLDAADQAQVVQRYQIALTVKQQYFNALAAREAIAAAQEQLNEANQQMAVTEAKIAGGSMSRADSLTSAVAVGQAKVALVTAQGSLVTANTGLTRMVGAGHEVAAIAADTALIPTISVDSSALIQLALNGPAMQQARHQVDANRSSWWASLGAYLPTFSVSYGSGSGWTNQHFILGGGTKNNNSALSFNLGFSLFNGLNRETRVVQADVNRDNAIAQLRDARLAAHENVAQYLAAFRTAETKIELQQLQIESATENVAAKDAQYRAGAVGLIDVLTAQTALAQAREQLIQARLDARTAKAQIESVIGKDLQ